MKAQLLAVAAATALVASSAVPTADARRRPKRVKFRANKTFGLGIMLGGPTGLAGKYYLSRDTALDFGVGAFRRFFRHHSAIQVHVDHLWHPVNLASADAFHLPLYFGVGGRLLLREFEDSDDDDIHLGLRVPVGVAMDFNNTPIDVFFELALVVDIVVAGDDDVFGNVNGLIGFRYYFD